MMIIHAVNGTRRNTGGKGEPAYGPVHELPPLAKAATEASASEAAARIGIGERTQVHVTDFYGDLDLLVGAFSKEEGKVHGWVWIVRCKGPSRGE